LELQDCWLFLGKISEPEFLAEATSPDKDTDQAQHCQAWAYAKTANETGLFEKSKALDELSRLNYDRFRAKRPAAVKREATDKAQAQLTELIRRGRAGEALERGRSVILRLAILEEKINQLFDSLGISRSFSERST
jgi:hypothetical protein